MAEYVGIDIIEISRIKDILERFGERFLNRIYTGPEIKLYAHKANSLAARFAGKEAVMKLLGTGLRGLSWKDIEILSQDSGRPYVTLYGRARERANELRLGGISISLSHSKEYAIASVISRSR